MKHRDENKKLKEDVAKKPERYFKLLNNFDEIFKCGERHTN